MKLFFGLCKFVNFLLFIYFYLTLVYYRLKRLLEVSISILEWNLLKNLGNKEKSVKSLIEHPLGGLTCTFWRIDYKKISFLGLCYKKTVKKIQIKVVVEAHFYFWFEFLARRFDFSRIFGTKSLQPNKQLCHVLKLQHFPSLDNFFLWFV